MTKEFSIPEIRRSDLETPVPFTLNQVMKFVSEQITKTQGFNGPFRYGEGPLTFPGNVSFSALAASAGVRLTGLQEFATNAAALAAGLQPGDLYKKATGELMVVQEP